MKSAKFRQLATSRPSETDATQHVVLTTLNVMLSNAVAPENYYLRSEYATFVKLASAEALAAADNWLVEQEGSALAAS